MTERDILGVGGALVGVGNGQQVLDRNHGDHLSVNLPLVSTVILPHDYRVNVGQNTDMLKDVYARILQRMKKLNLTEAGAGLACGLSKDGVRNIRRTVERGDTKAEINTKTLKKLAIGLKTSPEWLLEGKGDPDTQILAGLTYDQKLAEMADRSEDGRQASENLKNQIDLLHKTIQ